MIAPIPASDVSQVVRQKTGRDGSPLPVWSWQLLIGGVTVAFGERRTEQAARAAVQSAIQTQGLSLADLA